MRAECCEILPPSLDSLDAIGERYYPHRASIMAARREVLARLLRLNHARYAEEVAAGLHDKGKKAKGAKVRAAEAESSEAGAQLGLFGATSPRAAAPPLSMNGEGLSHAGGGRVTLAGGEAPSPFRERERAAAEGEVTPAESALLRALDAAAGPLGKAALVAAAGVAEGAWAGAIRALVARGLVEQRGEKRGATYVRKR